MSRERRNLEDRFIIGWLVGYCMKHINIYLEDNEHEKLIKLKGNKTWKQVLFDGVK